MSQFEGGFRVDTKPIRGLDFTSAGQDFVTICTRDRIQDHINRTIVINYDDNVETSRRDVSTKGR